MAETTESVKGENGRICTAINKNMKRRMLAFVLSCTLIVSGLAACGKDSGDKENTGKSGQKTELELFNNKQENIQTLQKLVDKFNEQSDSVSIKLNAPADPDTVLKTRMAKGDMPDIIFNLGARLYTELTASGYLEDMTGEDFYEKISPTYMEMLYAVTTEQKETAYGIPYAANGSGVIYNKDLFEEAGVEIPKTWDEFMSVCETLKGKGIQPFELTIKTAWTIFAPWNALTVGIQPENFVADRKEGKVAFTGTHEEVIEKLSKISEYAQDDYMGTSYEDGNKAFANEEAAMMLNGNWALPEILKTNQDLNVDMFAFPSTNDEEKTKVVSGIDVVFMMSTECKDKDGAKDFFRFMLQEENAQQYIDEQSAFSCVKGVEQEDEHVAGLKEDIASGKVAEAVDYTYPDGFDVGAIMSEFYLNKTNGMDDADNVAATVKKCDEQFDVLR